MPIFRNQCAVGRNVDLEAFFMADVEQLVDFRMEQRLSFYVQVNVPGVRPDLIQPLREAVHRDKRSLALRRRAKRTGEIADARNFYINFFKRFQNIVPIPVVLL